MIKVDRRRGPGFGIKFLIWVPNYSETSGGVIALHRLCHVLRSLGYGAYVHPPLAGVGPSFKSAFHYAATTFPMLRKITGKGLKLNPAWDTPMLPLGIDARPDRTVVVYPEIVSGNPFNARNVVRWFLHRPGFFTGKTDFGVNELYFDFNNNLAGYDPGPNVLGANRLHVVHYPFDIYNLAGAVPPYERKGLAYCVRKGRVTPSVDLTGATCIDGLPHAAVAEIFKRVETFISFDLMTAYSRLAALCGCVSIVVPPAGFTRDQWYPDEIDRFGIGFGLEDRIWAIETQSLVLPTLRERQSASVNAVRNFADEAGRFFGLTMH